MVAVVVGAVVVVVVVVVVVKLVEVVEVVVGSARKPRLLCSPSSFLTLVD